MNLTADTLFHFTSSLDNILNILKEGFYPRYCLEFWDDILGEQYNYSFPMVCFCDIPLTKTKEHVKKYGRYAIGLKKSWGTRKGITPVIYSHNKSITMKSLQIIINNLRKRKFELNSCDKEDDDEIFFEIMTLAKFAKPYKGKLWQNGKTKKKYVFYNEREWRFIPKIARDEKGPCQGMTESVFMNSAFRVDQNKKLEIYKLNFEPKDIKYIIISNDKEYDSIISFMTHYTNNIKLYSKIISLNSIQTDF